MSSLILPIEILADGLEIDFTESILVRKQKHLDKHVYIHEAKDKDCQINYLGYPVLNFKDDIALRNIVSNVADAQPTYGDDTWFEHSSNTLVVESLDVWITNKAIIQGSVTVPLFYGMILPSSTISATIGAYPNITSSLYWEYDSEAKVIYSNKTNYWHASLRRYEALTVRYTYIDSITGLEVIRSVLFENDKLYRESDLFDIDPLTLDFYTGRPVYSILPVGSKYELTLNGVGPFYIRQDQSLSIYLEERDKTPLNESWLLKFHNGQFQANGKSYSIPEYDNQIFFPSKPYRMAQRIGIVLNKNTIKAPDRNVVIDSERYLNFSLVVRDNENLLKGAYTTSQAISSTLYRPAAGETPEVRWTLVQASSDIRNGIIRVEGSILLLRTDRVEIKYIYRESSYEYPLNLNPNYNRRMLNHEYLFYIVPYSSGITQALFHLEYTYDPALGITRITDSNHPTIDVLGKSLDEFRSTYINSAHSYVELAQASLKNSIDSEDVHVHDVRLKYGISRENHLEVLKTHPWLYWNENYSDKMIEYPDKMLLVASIDSEAIEETDSDKYEDHIRQYIASGTSLIIESGGLQPRVKDIYSISPDEVRIEVMPEMTGSMIELYFTATVEAEPNLDTDLLVTTFSPVYAPSLHTEVVVGIPVGIIPDVASLYLAVWNAGYRSGPSQTFTVKVR